MFSKFINQNFGSGHVFELEIRNLLRAHGLSATTTGNDDRGVDIVAEADLGTRKVKFYIQCKYHNKAIGLEAIQEVYTGTSLRGNDGYPVVITNNRVTYEARKCAVKLGVEIIADREWQELQDGFEHYQVTDKTHYGLMGLISGANVSDFKHMEESVADLARAEALVPTEKPAPNEKLGYKKKIIKEKFDEALNYEQEAAELDRKASYLRQISLTLQKEATLNYLDYG